MSLHVFTVAAMASVLLVTTPLLAQTPSTQGKQPAQSLSHGDVTKQQTQSLSHGDVTKQRTQSLSHANAAPGDGLNKQQ